MERRSSVKILWIEDFANKLTNDYRAVNTKRFFGDFVSDIREKLDRLEAKGGKDLYRFIRRLTANDNPIYWCDGFHSGIQAVMEGFKEIKGKKIDDFEPPYDFIVLDVHLPLGDTPLLLKKDCSETTRLILRLFENREILPGEEIEAGFALYFLLIMEMGFPANRIVFLSAHAEAETIRNNFRQVKAAF